MSLPNLDQNPTDVHFILSLHHETAHVKTKYYYYAHTGLCFPLLLVLKRALKSRNMMGGRGEVYRMRGKLGSAVEMV